MGLLAERQVGGGPQSVFGLFRVPSPGSAVGSISGRSGSWAILIARLGHRSWVTERVEGLMKNGFILICSAKYKKSTFQGHRSRFLIPDWWRVITIWGSWQSSPLGKNQIFAEAKWTPWQCSYPWYLDLPAAMVVVVVMAMHVLHRDSAPHANHKRFDLALVLATSDAEITVLPPVLSPRVCSNLKQGKWDFYMIYTQIEMLKEESG